MKFLLDTNVILAAFWGKEPVASAVKDWISHGLIAVSTVSVAEVLSNELCK